MPGRPTIARTLPPPPAAGADVVTWRAAIRALPIEAREALAPLFQPPAVAGEKRAQRDRLLVDMAVGHDVSLRRLAEGVRAELLRYASAAWRYDRERPSPHNPDHAKAHRVLRLGDGEVPSLSTIRRAVAALAQNRGGFEPAAR